MSLEDGALCPLETAVEGRRPVRTIGGCRRDDIATSTADECHYLGWVGGSWLTVCACLCYRVSVMYRLFQDPADGGD